ncbi:MAG: alpha/beta hydrolase [Oligoflexia bacterium]|nr:alpha/beta hydrolase [Oligoflexia bacterium]
MRYIHQFTVLLLFLAFAAPWAARADFVGCIMSHVVATLEKYQELGPPKGLHKDHGLIALASGRKMFYDYEPARASKAGKAKPTVVLVHGLTEDLHSWDDIAIKLVDQGYGVLRMDLHGHGTTLAADLESNYSTDIIDYRDNVDDVIGLIQEKGVKNAYLVGHSMGGGIVAEVAARRDLPFRIKGMNLNAPYTYRLDSARAQMPQMALAENILSSIVPKSFMDMIMDPVFLDYYTFRSFRPHVENRYRLMRGIPEGQPLTALQSKWVDAVTQGAIGVMKGMRAVDVTSLVTKMPKVPITINMGEKDSLVPNHMHEDLYNFLKALGFDIKLNGVEGIGHALPQQASGFVLESIVDGMAQPAGR